MKSTLKYLDKYRLGKDVTLHNCRKINLYYWFRLKHSVWFYRDSGARAMSGDSGRLRRR
jgi:hypothetical protein